MLAIPVPFVVSMLFGLFAITLYMRDSQQTKGACGFLLLCCVTTFVVGLRWSFLLPVFHYIQPVLACLIPVSAWITFAHIGEKSRAHIHLISPLVVIVSLLIQDWLMVSVDFILTLIYLGYGFALLRQSQLHNTMLNVSLGHWESVQKSQQIAGTALLLSAVIDIGISVDFAINQGSYAIYILTTAHLLLLPILSLAVVTVAIHTPIQEEVLDASLSKEPCTTSRMQPTAGAETSLLESTAKEIIQALDENMRRKSSYLDPELTLSKLSRKLGYPAKQISIAVNQVHQRNISKLINEYRIQHAQKALVETKDSITQISLSSGFQTKSNFNREFSRVSGMSPSQYRKEHRAVKTDATNNG
ncbi:helix-turn-helix domain-containing protein [Vibrio sp. NH-7]